MFGSFVAGATPQGGGAVAFPVFTKLLGVNAPVARTFSLSIQAVGMGIAALIILVTRRPISLKAVGWGGASGLTGFLVGLLVVSDPTSDYWSSYIPGPFVKVSFTLVLGAMSWVVIASLRRPHRGTLELTWNRRVTLGIVAAGIVGGVGSALTGSGVDVAVFIFVVILCGLHPRVAVPTSILAMAVVSVAGLAILGIAGGQLSVYLDPSGAVVGMGAMDMAPAPAAQYDLFGLWLASIPIVIWGAPLGTWVAHVVHERGLIVLVGGLAAAEVLSTALFLDDLRTDHALQTFAVLGLATAIAGLSWAARNRSFFVTT